jgi:hypothetical protein
MMLQLVPYGAAISAETDNEEDRKQAGRTKSEDMKIGGRREQSQ